MKNRRWIACIAIAGMACTSVQAAESFLVPPDQSVAGRTQVEWSRSWWQWAASFPPPESPVADRTGELCGGKQGGDVWFLAGTYGTRRTVRKCTVPRGKYLFFPMINYIVYRTDGPVECESVTRQAARVTDDVSNLVLEVDGVRHEGLARHRQATDVCFNLGARMAPPQRIGPSAANGYYVMLKPLPPGEHQLNFGGLLPDMQQAVTYTLVVE